MTTSLLNSLLRALLRWGAALVFCLPLRHRTHFWARACGMLFPLLLLAQLLDPLAQSTTLWQQQLLLLVLYISFFALLGGMIYLCTDINKKRCPVLRSMEPAHRAVRLRELVLSGAAVYPVWTPAEYGFPLGGSGTAAVRGGILCGGVHPAGAAASL